MKFFELLANHPVTVFVLTFLFCELVNQAIMRVRQ